MERDTGKGVYNHLAPEIILYMFELSCDPDLDWIRANLSTQSADMWSVGCIFFTMLAGYEPFGEEQLISVLLRIHKTLGLPNKELHVSYRNFLELTGLARTLPSFGGRPESLETYLADASTDCLDLLSKMLSLEPKDRLTASQALAHPFFSKS